jgi:hypothetical protein
MPALRKQMPRTGRDDHRKEESEREWNPQRWRSVPRGSDESFDFFDEEAYRYWSSPTIMFWSMARVG